MYLFCQMMNYFLKNYISFLSDPLSLFFLITILIVTLSASIYSLGYLRGHYSSARIFLCHVLAILFVCSMAIVVTAGNLLLFLVAWEMMSLISYFLVLFDHEHEQSVKAATIYIVMTHIGTAFIIAAFLMLYKYAHSFDFAAIKSACQLMPLETKNVVFIFLLIGFGTKAGIVPLHIWLPLAHPQAPSHISSLMSGVMIKTAIYGIIRFVIFILGVAHAWWGILVLVLAVISCLVGVIYALMEHDLKRLLAYHSVENIGIILLGVGASMLFFNLNMPYLAVFSLAAGLYHLINHAIFKGLLFLCAGSIYNATATRDIEKLGGLIKKMPWTALCFLIGAMGISALPPLNGFVSEWLTLQAFFLGAIKAQGAIKLFLGICACMLALTGGLAASCFVKAFGITFLALPRSKHAENAKEVSLSMKLGMLILSLLTIIFGLAAAIILKILVKISGYALGIDISKMSFALNNFTLNLQEAREVYLSAPIIAVSLVLLGLLAVGIYFICARRKAITSRTWDCGYYKLGSRNEYTATAFSKPFRIAFSFFLLPYRRTQKIRESFYHVKSFSYETHTRKIFYEYFYQPLVAMIFKSARLIKRIQPGVIHLYIVYIFVTVFLLIMFMQRF